MPDVFDIIEPPIIDKIKKNRVVYSGILVIAIPELPILLNILIIT
tara:strand:+ start:311 stop:445 length:135 start_codon:yes stop_codon:yes gene_type:complete